VDACSSQFPPGYEHWDPEAEELSPFEVGLWHSYDFLSQTLLVAVKVRPLGAIASGPTIWYSRREAAAVGKTATADAERTLALDQALDRIRQRLKTDAVAAAVGLLTSSRTAPLRL